MLRRRPRHPALLPFVKALWANDGAGVPRPGATERVLPTGDTHLAIRLDAPLRLPNRTVGHAVIGGARSDSYVRDTSRPSASVGAQLHPGASLALCGAPAGELAEGHHRLEDLWDPVDARRARERLAGAASLEERLAVFEGILVERISDRFCVAPLATFATRRFAAGADVGSVVEESGYSHRRFVELFRSEVGLAPKVYCRVLRFQRAVEQLSGTGRRPLGAIAFAAGYSDQPHLTREFRAFAGLSPGEYRRAAPALSHHVPVGQFRSRPSGTSEAEWGRAKEPRP